MITDTRNKIYSYIIEKSKVRVHDIVKVFHLSNVAVHKQLKKLLEEGKIQKIGKPPMVFYIQAQITPTVQELQKKIVPLLKQARVKRAALFGSYVRGDNTRDSDIDILIAFPSDATLLDFAHLKRTLEEELQKEVDIVSYNGISPLLRDSILNNQYPIL